MFAQLSKDARTGEGPIPVILSCLPIIEFLIHTEKERGDTLSVGENLPSFPIRMYQAISPRGDGLMEDVDQRAMMGLGGSGEGYSRARASCKWEVGGSLKSCIFITYIGSGKGERRSSGVFGSRRDFPSM
jgi:hypothetical protein